MESNSCCIGGFWSSDLDQDRSHEESPLGVRDSEEQAKQSSQQELSPKPSHRLVLSDDDSTNRLSIHPSKRGVVSPTADVDK